MLDKHLLASGMVAATPFVVSVSTMLLYETCANTRV